MDECTTMYEWLNKGSIMDECSDDFPFIFPIYHDTKSGY